MPDRPFRLSWTLAREVSAEEEDVRRVKGALRELGYYDGEPDAHVDSGLFVGIQRFQRDHGLQADGRIKPGGPTEARIRDEVALRRPERVRAEAAASLTGFEDRKEIHQRAREHNRRLAERWRHDDVPSDAVEWTQRTLLEGDPAAAIQAADLAAQSPALRLRLSDGVGLLADKLATAAQYDVSRPPQKILDRAIDGLRLDGYIAFAKVDDVNRPRHGDRKLFKAMYDSIGIGVELAEGGVVLLRDPAGRRLAELPRAFARSIAEDPAAAQGGFNVLAALHAGQFTTKESRRAFATRRQAGVGAEFGDVFETVDQDLYAALGEAEAARRAGADEASIGAILAPALFPEALEDAQARGSVLLSLLPGLGNVTSAIEAMERAVEAGRALGSGNGARAAEEAALALIAAAGATPGPGASLAALTRTLRPALREAPGFGMLLAQKRGAKYLDQFNEDMSAVPLQRIIGDALNDLSTKDQAIILGVFPNILGSTAEREVIETAKKVGIEVNKANPKNKTYQRTVHVNIDGKREKRVYDAQFEQHFERGFHWLFGRLARVGKRGKVMAEVKQGASPYGGRQERIDNHWAELMDEGIEDVALLRLRVNQVPEAMLIDQTRKLLTPHVKSGRLSQEQFTELQRRMRDWHRDENSLVTTGEAIAMLARAVVSDE